MNKKIGIFVLFALFIFSLFVPLVTADTAPLLDEGLVLYLPFDEGSGIVAVDQSGFNNHGQITGATFVDGKYSYGLSFDGNDYVDSGHSASLDYTNLTVSFWFNTTAPNAGRMVAKETSDWIASYAIYMAGGTVQLFSSKNSPNEYVLLDSVTTYNNGELHFVVVTLNLGNVSLYVDDVLKDSETWAYGAIINSEKTMVGCSNYGGSPFGYYSGIIDEVRIYNRTLTQSEITFLFENPQPTPTPAPAATPIPQDMATSAIMSTIILVILVIVNIVFLGVVHSAMVRFLFALLTLMIGIASLTISQVTFNPYLQMVTVVMSLLCMVLAAKAKS